MSSVPETSAVEFTGKKGALPLDLYSAVAIEILIKIKPIPFLNDNLRNCYGIFP